MKKQFRTTTTPFPEVVSAGWTVVPASTPFTGSVDFQNKRMVVPTDNTPQAEYIRLHELMHATISPHDIPAFMAQHDLTSADNVNAAEDLRITLALQRRPSQLLRDIARTPILSAEPGLLSGIALGISKLPPAEQIMTWARLVTSTFRTADAAAFRQILHDRIDPVIAHPVREFSSRLNNLCYEYDGRTTPPIDFTVDVARLLDALQSKWDTADWQTSSNDEPLDDDADSDNQWGTAVIETPRLHDAIKLRHTRLRHRMTDEGTKLKSLHRLCTDRRLFAVKKRSLGGSVLIDVSGSMSLDHDDIMELVLAAPASIVAVYEGHPDTQKGCIRIIAKHGQLVDRDSLFSDDPDLHGGGNVIDGPALRWLGTQTEPRYWVCDGQVTGYNDAPAPNLKCEAQELQDMFHITRLDDIETALDTFQARRRARR